MYVRLGIGLDPALPLITNSIRLSQNDAHMVQTIQTNAGYYGDIGSIGHVDICMNDGNVQPFCTDTQSKSRIEKNIQYFFFSLSFIRFYFDCSFQIQIFVAIYMHYVF